MKFVSTNGRANATDLQSALLAGLAPDGGLYLPESIERQIPEVVAVHDRVAARPGIKAYLASERRIAFNEDGIFRRYPELDR